MSDGSIYDTTAMKYTNLVIMKEHTSLSSLRGRLSLPSPSRRSDSDCGDPVNMSKDGLPRMLCMLAMTSRGCCMLVMTEMYITNV